MVADVSKTLKRVNPRKASLVASQEHADKLVGVFTDIFNLSLSQSAVLSCFKMSTIVSCTQAKVMELNDTYVRMLFIDFCSAVNTIVPSKLLIKLRALSLNPALCNWVLDFLIGCPYVVRVGNKTSTSLILNTGAPQG